MQLNQTNSNFSDLFCLFNNGLSLVTSKDSLIKNQSRRQNQQMSTRDLTKGSNL